MKKINEMTIANFKEFANKTPTILDEFITIYFFKKCVRCGFTITDDDTSCKPNDCSMRPIPSYKIPNPYSQKITLIGQLILFANRKWEINISSIPGLYHTCEIIIHPDPEIKNTKIKVEDKNLNVAICITCLLATFREEKLFGVIHDQNLY
jgi:hypothetical protein